MRRKRTAAVYDRWLFTLGGGEQVAFAYAESLRDLGFTTTILTHKDFDRKKAERKMGVNLKNIETICLPNMATREISQFTEKYDVFINTSYLDYFPSRSNTGILSIFFPTQIVLSPLEFLKRGLIIPSFRRFFVYPLQFEGFLFDEYIRGTLYKWLGKSASITFDKPLSRFSLTLYFRSVGVSIIDRVVFELNGRVITPLAKKLANNEVTYRFVAKTSEHSKLSIILPRPLVMDAALVRFSISSWRYKAYNIFKRIFPTWEMRLHGGPGITKLADLKSYQQIWTISQFSQNWINSYWGLKSEVLYPPVNVQKFSPASRKKNWIVHVGRFFVTGHCKKQLDLIKVFRQLVDEGELRDWELHFVGSVHEGVKHQQYFDQVKYFSKGYPVKFHTDAPFSELKKVLGAAKIYWHATGLDEDEEDNPILFEHFGITTVEAMASGCVPIVIHAGGQKEIVKPGSGFTWKSREELHDLTLRLTRDPKLWKKLSKGALSRSKVFGIDRFHARFKKLLKD